MFAFFTRLFKRVDHLAPLKAIYRDLFHLRGNLSVGVMNSYSNPLDRLVYFFDVVSKWHDRGIGEIIQGLEQAGPRYAKFLESVKTLQAHFDNAGRNQFGWNRTEEGEKVTADKVFLGNIWGLWTKPVSFWKDLKDEPKGGWGHSGEVWKTLNAYDVVCQQAADFMNSHITGISATIAQLEADLDTATSEPATIKRGCFCLEAVPA